MERLTSHYFTMICLVLCVKANSQAFIDNYLNTPLIYTTVGSTVQGVNKPRDLDFKPHSNELWVANYGSSNGGTSVIIYNAGETNQTSEHRGDSHSSHFMVYPSAIAFSDVGEWGCTSEIKNTSFPASTFMGPALWSGDTNIYARVFQNGWNVGFPLGSHLDMLHQSPFSMGIAHEADRIYWVFDGWNGNLCKYNFGADHSAGYDDHSDGVIWRYTDIALTRTVGIPSHMIMDKTSKWLYIVDGGTKSLIRVNTNTGTIAGNLVTPNTGGEFLASYKNVTGAVKENIDTFTGQPCGIDYSHNRLIVGDYNSGDIRVYDTSTPTVTLLGTIVTGQPGIMGLKIGYDGKIWFVNELQNTVVRIDRQPLANDASIAEIISPSVTQHTTNFHSPDFNYCAGIIAPVVVLKNNGTNTLTSADISYQIDNLIPANFPWAGSLGAGSTVTLTLPSSVVPAGEHKIYVTVSNPNNTTDNNPMNDKREGAFRSRDILKSLPFSEDFSSTAFPPAEWSYAGFNKHAKMSYNPNIGGYSSGLGCLQMDNVGGAVDITGQTDYFISPRINFSNTGAATDLTFDVAYAQYTSSTKDSLNVRISTDCGNSWTIIYGKGGANLSTASPTMANFIPEAGEWRTETVNLGAYSTQPEILLLFTTISNYGNYLYIDNITINHDNNVGITTQAKDPGTNLFPSPTNGMITARVTEPIISIQVYNTMGRLMKDEKFSGSGNEETIDLTELSHGVYMLRIKTESQILNKKVLVVD